MSKLARHLGLKGWPVCAARLARERDRKAADVRRLLAEIATPRKAA